MLRPLMARFTLVSDRLGSFSERIDHIEVAGLVNARYILGAMIKFTIGAMRVLTILAACLAASAVAAQPRGVLFDASHRENAGNADWIIDADAFDLNQPHFPCGGSDFEDESRAQRFPTPPASGIDASTDESYWTGGISAFGVDLVKLGFAVESLPPGGAITFGDGGNPQDLANYDVFVLPEPNQPYTPTETTAIRDFVAAGGGLFLLTDHQTSDRDCDGFDSPHIGNDLMGVVVSGGVITDFGLFGIVFNVSEIAGQTSADYWFTDAIDDNVTTDPADPIINGPHGDGSGGLGFFGATAMTIDPAANPTVKGHVWKTDAGGQGTTRVTFATAQFGNGRLAAIGDSSPADDGTGDPFDNLHFGWDLASGGVANKQIHLNAVEWLAGDDTTPPIISGAPTAVAGDCSATISWTTDEPADGVVSFGPTAVYGSTVSDSAPSLAHAVTLAGLVPGSLYHYSVMSTDPSGNASAASADATFNTSTAAAPLIVSGPTVSAITSSTARIQWQTDEPADSLVNYGLSPAHGSTVNDPAFTSDHELIVTGLAPTTTYHFAVSSSDACGNGPVTSADDSFLSAEPAIDLSGWVLLQFDSSQSFAFPPGTTIPGGGYLVLGREATQSAFEAEWGALPADTVYIDSGGVFPFINGGESFRLEDELGGIVDGTTIAMSSGQSIQRSAPGAPAGDAGSWNVTPASSGSPGSGAGASSAAGVVINEAADASAFQHEFVELFNDATPAGPDTVPPAGIVDLTAEPLSDDVVRLSWTAGGDDAVSGTATAYDIRAAAWPITSDASFATADQLVGEPAPQVAGSTESWDLGGFDPNTTRYFAMRVIDEVGNASPLSNTTGATTAPSGGATPPVADHVVISELRSRGAVDQDDEFIELHNPTASAVDLTGWSVQYKSAGGTTWLRENLPSAGIPPFGYFLLARPEYGGAAVADATWSSFQMSGSGGHVFLVAGASTLNSCGDAAIVDQLGYGGGNCPETSAAPAHAAGESLERKPGSNDPLCGNGSDTDDNSADFDVLTAPDPQNSIGPSEPPCVSLGNVGASLYFGSPSGLRWATALGAADYKLRRAGARDFMQSAPPPDDTYLLQRTANTDLDDAATPTIGAAFYYVVTATDGASVESDD